MTAKENMYVASESVRPRTTGCRHVNARPSRRDTRGPPGSLRGTGAGSARRMRHTSRPETRWANAWTASASDALSTCTTAPASLGPAVRAAPSVTASFPYPSDISLRPTRLGRYERYAIWKQTSLMPASTVTTYSWGSPSAPKAAATGIEPHSNARAVWAPTRRGRRGIRSTTRPANRPRTSQGTPPTARSTPTCAAVASSSTTATRGRAIRPNCSPSSDRDWADQNFRKSP